MLHDPETTTQMTPQFSDLSAIPEHASIKKKLRILLLADNRHQANVVQDHINGFLEHTRHNIRVVNPIHEKPPLGMVYRYDAVLIHYSIFILGEYYLSPAWVKALKGFRGVKAQIIQDEHRYINLMQNQMNALGISLVFSSLSVDNLSKVYSSELVRDTCFYSCLPGYISKSYFSSPKPPIAERPHDVVYRGRTLPAFLGKHAQDKKRIGDQFIQIAEEFGLKVDISSDESARIYGEQWLHFLCAGRATLGVEGGASIFDFDGTVTTIVNAHLEAYPKANFEEIWDTLLQPYEGNVVHKTITPKIFEAIASKTALVLYPGEYRDVLTPYKHYIPFMQDGSNKSEVVSLLKDEKYLQEMVDATYQEIMNRYDVMDRYYVQKVEAALTNKLAGI